MNPPAPVTSTFVMWLSPCVRSSCTVIAFAMTSVRTLRISGSPSNQDGSHHDSREVSRSPAGAPHDLQHRPRQNLGVEPDRPRVDVPGVELDDLLEVPHRLVAGELPEAGDAGAHREAPPVMRAIRVDLVERGRARAHQAHLAAEHVPEL